MLVVVLVKFYIVVPIFISPVTCKFPEPEYWMPVPLNSDRAPGLGRPVPDPAAAIWTGGIL